MKKLVYTLSLMGALAVGANAGVTKVTPANTDAEGCYLIGSAGELLGFAEIVNGIPADAENGIEEVPAKPGVCGKLTSNISFLDRTLLNADLTGFNGDQAPDANNWTPMENFSGKFDGQGYTISGLFYGGTDVTNAEGWPEKAGLFINLGDNAIVNRLSISDSYFGATSRAGSIAAVISGTNVTINRCSFDGIVNTVREKARTTSVSEAAQSHIGGLIGILENSASLKLTSSINMGNIILGSDTDYGKNLNRGGIIGRAEPESDITIQNTHGIGFVNLKTNNAITSTEDTPSYSKNKIAVYCIGTGKVCNKNFCGLTKDSSTVQIIAACEKAYTQHLTNTIGFEGVSLEYGTRDDGRKIVIAHITENDASRDDNVLQKLVIPEDFPADSVDFDRPFKGNSSTVMIPFDIAAANVTNYNGNNVLLGSVESISCKNDEVKECEATAANAQAQIEAHTPYLVSAFDVNQEMEPIGNIPVGQTIHFHGPVVLKKNNADDSYKVSVGDDWSLVGTYKTLITTSSEDAASDYEKVSMLGKIFGFVGTAEISDGEGDNKHDFTLGEFARAGHNVRTREMRSYLIYSVPNPSPKPSINGMQRMAALSTEGEVELPSSIPVTFESRPIIPVPAFVDTTVKPTTMVQVIMPSYSDDECDSEEGECEEEGTAAIAKPFISPLKSNKVDRWQDAMGRSLNGKPTKHGSYFKNGIPVIIK